jgi:hypothetical protein
MGAVRATRIVEEGKVCYAARSVDDVVLSGAQERCSNGRKGDHLRQGGLTLH